MAEKGKEHSEIKNAKIDSFGVEFENGLIVIKVGFTFAIGGLYYENRFVGDILSDIFRVTEAESLTSIVGSAVRVTVEKGDNHSFRVTRLWHFLNDTFCYL